MRRPLGPKMSEMCEGVVPVEVPRYRTLSPSPTTSDRNPFRIAAASLLLKGSHSLKGAPSIMTMRSP